MRALKTLFLLCFAGVGAVFLVISAVLGVSYTQKSAGCVEVTGVIMSIEHGSTPIVAYDWEGERYTLRASTHSSSMRPGMAYSVLVHPDRPWQPMDHTMRLLSVIFAIVGAALTAAGLIVHAALGGGEKRRIALLSYGRRVTAEVTEIRSNRSVTMMGRHPLYVLATARHPLTGDTVTVRSHQMMRTQLAPGDQVDVAFDPMNEKKYAFDIREDA